mgnify:CR=1 FL=1
MAACASAFIIKRYVDDKGVLGVGLLGGDEAVHHGVDAEARHAFDAQFGGDVFAVGEHSVDADV